MAETDRDNHMTVGQFVAAAFELSRQTYGYVFESWITVSCKVGGLLPKSLLIGQIQDIGHLDILLRCMEDETRSLMIERQGNPGKPFDIQDFNFHYQSLLSRMWVSNLYEVTRLLKVQTS